MKVECFIDETMEQISDELKMHRISYENKLTERGICIRYKAMITAGIVLYITECKSGVDAWAFYPKTQLEDYISSTNASSDEEVEEFYNICIDNVLKRHSWHNPEIERVIEYRKKTHTAAIEI